MTLYRDILKQSIKTTWHNKYLWFFGLFAALLGNGGELEVLFRSFDGGLQQGLFPGIKSLAETGIFSAAAVTNIGKIAVNDPLSLLLMVSIMLVVLVVGAFIVWMTVSSQAALVSGSAKIKLGRKPDFRTCLDSGLASFWKVLGMNILQKIIIYLAFLLLSLPVLASLNQPYISMTSLMFVISFIIFVPLAIIISFIIKYAIAYVVIKGGNILESLHLGWQLFVKNWLISVEMAFLLFFLNFLVGIGLMLFLLIISVPFLFIALVLAKIGFLFNFWALIILGILVFIIATALVGAFLATFQIASWTGLFMELVSRGGVSKLTRIFNKE